MRKVGLYITTLLHDVTQAGFQVSFHRDFKGMVRIDFKKVWDEDFYHHEHCGFPGAKREQLEQHIIDALVKFKNDQDVPSVTEHGDEV